MRISKYRITIGIILVLIIMILVTVIFPEKNYTSKNIEIIDSENVNEFFNEDIIEQTFIPDDNYKSIGIQIATYASYVKDGELIVFIENEKGQVKKYSILARTIIDNQIYYLNYKTRKNHKYRIIIDGERLSSPITFLTTQAEMPGYELMINNTKSNSNLILAFIKNKKNYFNIWYYLLIISILSSYAILIKESR